MSDRESGGEAVEAKKTSKTKYHQISNELREEKNKSVREKETAQERGVVTKRVINNRQGAEQTEKGGVSHEEQTSQRRYS